ncbi:hypothetical protein LOD99_2484 [Oopsacas minuta]|uniref:GPI ethanolamine phosphate transferase 1 n=1 Tax=Oopsacas minuta TaxID=111878 RepID=A0AAV7K3N9_9METZ|nr:hypothetical protein LOD99_2484 [Oopsacas minuta]
MDTEKITKGLLDLSLAQLNIFSWFMCVDGSLPSGLDMVHLLLFPSKSVSDKPEWDKLCRASKMIELPLPVKEIVGAEKHNNLFNINELFDSLTCLALATVLFIIFSYFLHFVLNRTVKVFRNIYPVHKKWYVIANILKACLLAFICLNTQFYFGIYALATGGFVPMIELKRTTVLYIVSDFAGLIMVPRLPFTTKMHHYVTFFIGILIWSSNLNSPGFTGVIGVAKMAFIYGLFSCIPFLVNLFLGLRICVPKNKAMVVLSFIAFLTYILCCALNWSSHLVWLINCIISFDITIWAILYLLMLVYIVRDDLILMNFLRKYSLSNFMKKKQ